MRLDWTRLIRGLALLAWALFFDFLWLTDRGSLYVGPRTTWVVAFGGITLTPRRSCTCPASARASARPSRGRASWPASA
jgi:hypothetical protein